MENTPEPEVAKAKPPLGRYRATRIALWSWALPLMFFSIGVSVVSQIFSFLPRSSAMGSRLKVTGAAMDVTILLGCTGGLILGVWGISMVPKFGPKGILAPSIVGLILSVLAFALVVLTHAMGWRTKM